MTYKYHLIFGHDSQRFIVALHPGGSLIMIGLPAGVVSSAFSQYVFGGACSAVMYFDI